jgi:hypothetical protein
LKNAHNAISFFAMPPRVKSKVQAVANPAEVARCERCGIIYQGTPSLIGAKMRLHNKVGCVDVGTSGPENTDSNPAQAPDTFDKAMELLSRTKSQHLLRRGNV